MTTVINKHDSRPSGIHSSDPRCVYIGRGSKWGNPFSHLPSSAFPSAIKVKTRAEAIEKYRQRLRERPDLMAQARAELRDKILVCFCKPQACHGDILARIADGGEI